MTVIAFDTKRHRAEGKIIMYGKEIGETFEAGEEVIVVCEVRPLGTIPQEDAEQLDDNEKIPCTVRTPPLSLSLLLHRLPPFFELVLGHGGSSVRWGERSPSRKIKIVHCRRQWG
jgi:hypothetical protein